ncbi:hypothetical protein J8L98_05000 [Pseudoalteromonas sp. MMG013]|uniref:hypothetical protein n=1 Tax=Pseudoalteromonas sp. MMG013 TaxID=2822687 RepID=UPI001B3617E0|nr:hypothetical protein [Pseudoalteromonas sp. MMG013]MBQ4861055.1 hypothetical protein [Pseudoalteromonas sp. MMG013]
MNLSTSNSDQDNSNIGTPVQSRRVFMKITLAITLVMVTAMGLVRVLLDANGANQQGILGRVLQAKAALPNIIAEPNDLVMFYGSSMVRAGFSPRKFDRDLKNMGKNITSFNFGFGGLNPYYQDLLSRRIAEQFVTKNRQLKLALIEFNPFQATTTRWDRAQFTVDSYITMLANNDELWRILREDLTRGVHLYNIKYIRNHVSAEMITSYYAREIFPPYRRDVFQDNEKVTLERRKLGRELNTLFKKEYPNYQGEEWYYPWQGAGTIPEERAAHTLEVFDKYYAVTQTDAQMKNDRLSRIRTTDIEDMHFEPRLITSFINIVKNFQRFSNTVEVVMLPKNSRYITYSAAGKHRLAQAIQQIEQATGITIKNHQDISAVTPDMFRDTTHLSRYRGDIAYTDFLVKEYAKSL